MESFEIKLELLIKLQQRPQQKLRLKVCLVIGLLCSLVSAVS